MVSAMTVGENSGLSTGASLLIDRPGTLAVSPVSAGGLLAPLDAASCGAQAASIRSPPGRSRRRAPERGHPPGGNAGQDAAYSRRGTPNPPGRSSRGPRRKPSKYLVVVALEFRLHCWRRFANVHVLTETRNDISSLGSLCLPVGSTGAGRVS